MTFLRALPVLAAFLCLLFTAPEASAATKKKPAQAANNDYKGFIVVDASTGQSLLEENADIVHPPASMTKLMTFAVLHDLLDKGTITLQTPMTVDAKDARIGGTQVYLAPNEVFPVEDLIFAMMIHSANDAAHTLARNSVGSVSRFVNMMNEKARELGMTRTTFRTPHGLPPDNRKTSEFDVTTPRDFALLCRYLLQHTDVLRYTSVRQRDFGRGQRPEIFKLTTHNQLIGKVQGVDGLKTGFHNAGGFCLATTALRNNHRVIVVILGSTLSKNRDAKVIELLDEGFGKIPLDAPAFATTLLPASAAAASSPIAPAPLSASEKSGAAAAAQDELSIKLSVPPAKKSKTSK